MTTTGEPTTQQIGAQGPTQVRVATVFAMRMAASHGLTTYLVWLAFTSKSAAAAGWVLVARAVASLVVPLTVGRMHDRGGVGPWLRVCAVVEAVAAVTLAYVGWHGAASWVMVALSLVLGVTSAMFDTVVFPILLAARPGRLRAHVLVGLSYDVAKVFGSSVVLALLFVWDSPWPVMVVSLLALAGWRLKAPPPAHHERPQGAAPSPWRVMEVGPVVAISTAALLPGQMNVFQVVAADHSFWRYAVLGTAFALGAVVGNFGLQRMDVSRRTVALAYAMCGTALLGVLTAPVLAFALYGTSMAVYWQMTRVLVIERAPAEARGRVSAAMIGATRTVAVVGSVLAAALVHHTVSLRVGAALVALVCAVAVQVTRRPAAQPVLA